MINAKQTPVLSSCGDRAKGALSSLKNELDVEKSDRLIGHLYLPMDVYVDTRTIKEHFQAAPICEQWDTRNKVA